VSKSEAHTETCQKHTSFIDAGDRTVPGTWKLARHRDYGTITEKKVGGRIVPECIDASNLSYKKLRYILAGTSKHFSKFD